MRVKIESRRLVHTHCTSPKVSLLTASTYLSETHVAVYSVHLRLFGHGPRVHVGQEVSGAPDDDGVGEEGQRQADVREHVLCVVFGLCSSGFANIQEAAAKENVSTPVA